MARLAAFDMDGTLLMPDHHLGEKTLSTLARLRERDITLTFATGRHALEMQHILGALSLDAYLITGNGTRVGNDSNLLIVFYVQIMPDDLVMQLHRF